MAARQVAFFLTIVLVLAVVASARSSAQDQPVRSELAAMIEQVVARTGFSINIGKSTPTSVNINQVNGRDVCSAVARDDVERLQRAFDAHPNIYSNIGPALISFTDRAGRKSVGDKRMLEKNGILKECPNIYVSVHE